MSWHRIVRHVTKPASQHNVSFEFTYRPVRNGQVIQELSAGSSGPGHYVAYYKSLPSNGSGSRSLS